MGCLERVFQEQGPYRGGGGLECDHVGGRLRGTE